MKTKKICLISLGCAKNLVNSEQMLFLLAEAEFEIVPEPQGADVCVVNTCGFIDSAKAEAIDTILELAELKSEAQLGKIVVCGCLAERYKDEILVELPEIDALVGVGSFDEIVAAVEAVLVGEMPRLFGDKNAPVEETGRILSTGPGWAYLKIAEGCDNRCAFCVIPSIRGRYRSRPMESILDEARALVDSGIREIIVVAQDITRYGTDLYGKRSLAAMLRELVRIDGIDWLRLHYLYPDAMDDELIELIAAEPKILKYLDIPVQHISNSILKRMNRRGTGDDIRALFAKLRREIPGLVLRTSLIVGLPGEGEAEFEELCDFLREAKIERAGVFVFSPEEGTPAAGMLDRCDEAEAQRRAELVMQLQAEVMDEFNESRIGEELIVIVEGFDPEIGLMFGRSWADSPEVDGKVYFDAQVAAGEFVSLEITKILDGDLKGEVLLH